MLFSLPCGKMSSRTSRVLLPLAAILTVKSHITLRLSQNYGYLKVI